MNNKEGQTIYLKYYRAPAFLIDNVYMYIDLYEEKTNIKTVLSVRRNLNIQTSLPPLILNGEAMTLKRIALNGQLLSSSDYTINDSSLIIPDVPEEFILESEVIIQPHKNTRLTGLYKSQGNFCTQCEPHGFRRITYFLDRPDVLARYTTTITADKDKYPFILSNGNLIETKILEGNRHLVHWEDPYKKPSYLFALVAGNFDLLEDSFVTQSGREVALRLYLEKGYKDQGSFALQALKQAMKWDEEKFGREYDLDVYMIVAVSDFNMGAMENKGLNIFNTKNILANSKTATDEDYIRIKNVIGHEYFHNWSGNRVTCRDWFQITLKEGLTVLRDQLFIEDVTSKSVARIKSVNYLRNVQFAEDAGPMAHPIRPDSYIEVNNFYTSTVYNKGAEVIRMIRTLLGSAVFRKAMDLYFWRYDGKAVTTEDFIQAMVDASNKNFNQFKRWYDQTGTPVLNLESKYNENTETLTLKVKQFCPPSSPGESKKLPLHIPLALGFVSPKCQDIPTQLEGEDEVIQGTRILEIQKLEEQFKFINVKDKPVLSLLRNFSAPVHLNYPYTDEELLWLFQCDSDPFARWEAGQVFAKRLIFNLVTDYQEQKLLKLDNRFIEIFQKIIQGPHKDHGYDAALLLLPKEAYLMQFMKNMDIEVLHTIRQFVKKELSSALILDLTITYKNYQLPIYVYSEENLGKRALKNCCLEYLTENGGDQYLLAYQQFKNSDNMTDIMGALVALINHECEERQCALDEFYQKWKNYPILINKWMALQASSQLPSTIQIVKKLIQHPAFDIKNPNNVYALLVTFGMNVVCFHDKSGEGYRLIADQILKIDSMNPQVAARVLQPLSRWQIMDEKRQGLMKAELNRIAEAPRLSPDISEIVKKSLR